MNMLYQIKTISFAIIFFLFCFCQKDTEPSKEFAQIGGKAISQESYNAFEKMRRQYPTNTGEGFFPGSRSLPTVCIETEIIYRKAKAARKVVENRNDWKWKKSFFPAQLYLIEVLDMNWGFSEKQIEEYYQKNKDEFKKTIKVKVTKDSSVTTEDNTKSDSSKAIASDSTKIEYRDSTTIRSLEEVRGKIARNLFLTENPPDSAFFVSVVDSADTAIDTSLIENQWLSKIRRNLPNFFMKKFYKKYYNSEYPDSLDDIYGEGKVITPADMDVILLWLPEGRRESYKAKDKQRYLAEWLLKWKLFAQEAEKNGFSKSKEISQLLEWAWKYEVTLEHINNTLVKQLENSVTVDTAMCIYERWDQTSKPGIYPDTADLRDIVESNLKTKKQIKLDSLIYSMRIEAKVQFMQSDYIDDKVLNPDSLATEADSLYGAGNSDDAKNAYKKLVDNFPFTTKGQNALIELAKIYTEKERYRDAVKNYRKFLLSSLEIERRCNIFFMIGFVYGEYLNKPELAEASYKWILKNTPECELTDDAEFMCLHLDEPMIGVDELQAEAKRQGRKIGEEEPVTETEG